MVLALVLLALGGLTQVYSIRRLRQRIERLEEASWRSNRMHGDYTLDADHWPEGGPR